MRIQRLNTSAAELHEIDQNYSRYNQKHNIFIRLFWDEEIKRLEHARQKNAEQYSKDNKPGYSKFDKAFLAGTMNFMREKIVQNIHICDQEFNAWNGEKGTKEEGMDTFTLTKAIKKAAKMYGACAVGIAPLDRRWVYSHWYDLQTRQSYPIQFSDEAPEYNRIQEPTLLENKARVIPASMKTAIVMLFEMDPGCLKYSPTLLPYANGRFVYSEMCLTTNSLAGLIRELGYNAIPSVNCTALNIPLAIDAGLGQIGRNGKLINPYLGTRIRIAKVITDLPLDCDQPIDFGVNEFCEACRKCARKCPAGAIPSDSKVCSGMDELSNNGYLRWAIDHKKCFCYWSECGTNCNICITVCSYNRGYKWTKSILNSSKESSTLVDNLLDSLDDCGPDVFDPEASFWLNS
ncbi:reductive dehalogenase [Desulfitobacterium sp. PCE1]|uniref:reductive dehalogenase n=1 Tax=Desulfitobacterium sp. PCE1 TaxID=146907 RepID=UPI00036CBEA7|nr:reductive dehalogenase [Desulfitobacterium sp. PCE1]